MDELICERPWELIVDGHIHITVRHTCKMVHFALIFLKLPFALQDIAVNLFVVLYYPIYALIFVIFLLQIVIETLFQVSKCTGESGALRFDFVKAQLQSRNQSSFLFVRQSQLTLFKELFKVMEMLAEIDEVLTRIV